MSIKPKLTLVKPLHDFDALFNEISECIRTGHGAKAKAKFYSIERKHINNALDRTRYANLARRLSLPEEALKLLHPFVRPTGRIFKAASEEEKIEYAASLLKIGATNEALSLLKTLDAKAHPKVYQMIAFAHITTWEYEEAIPWLNKYIESSSITPYEKLVAEANLSESMGHIKHPDAQSVIAKTLEEAEKNNHKIIVGHVLKIKAISAINEQNFKTARETLAQAEKYYSSSDTIESFFIRKWKAILNFYQEDKHSLTELNAIREEAKTKWKHRETVRDCDFHEAVITKNESLFSQLYFGTPFPSFRKRLMQAWQNHEAMPKFYNWRVNTFGNASKTLELFSGDSRERKKLLKSSRHISALLSILASDFYRGMDDAFLFSKLYLGDFYDPGHSPAKVRLIIHRVRKYLKKEKLPLIIKEEKGLYSLGALKPTAIVIPQNIVVSQIDLLAQKTDLLQSILAKQIKFNAKDVCDAFKVNRRAASRLLKQAIDSGLIVRTGFGRSSTYAWANTQVPQFKAA